MFVADLSNSDFTFCFLSLQQWDDGVLAMKTKSFLEFWFWMTLWLYLQIYLETESHIMVDCVYGGGAELKVATNVIYHGQTCNIEISSTFRRKLT